VRLGPYEILAPARRGSRLALIAVAAMMACASVDNHFAPSLAVEEASYSEAYKGPRPISARQALRSALQSLEQRGVTDVRICRIHWIVAGYGAAIVQATGRWQKDAVTFNAFAVAIADGTEVRHGHAGGDELWVIARGVDQHGAETYYDSAANPTIQLYSEIAKDPDEGFVFEVVSREELAALPSKCSAGAIARWPLREQLVREQSTVLPADAQVFAFAEVYRGDEAMLLACATMSETLVPFAATFEKKNEGWSLQQRFARESEIDAMLHAPEAKIVRRQAGLPLDSLPRFFASMLSDRAPKFREALERHDFEQCAAIAEEMLTGFTVDNAQTVLSALGNPAPASKVTLLMTKQQEDGRLLATFAVDDKYGPSTSRYFLAKEGKGWVIEERYSGPATRTLSRMQDIAVAMESYQVDHDERYPQAASLEELRQMLQPKYMPAVPLTDAWRTPIRFEVSEDRKRYRLISAGADRKFNPESWAVANEELTDFAEDAVFEKGAFVRMWRTSD